MTWRVKTCIDNAISLLVNGGENLENSQCLNYSMMSNNRNILGPSVSSSLYISLRQHVASDAKEIQSLQSRHKSPTTPATCRLKCKKERMYDNKTRLKTTKVKLNTSWSSVLVCTEQICKYCSSSTITEDWDKAAPFKPLLVPLKPSKCISQTTSQLPVPLCAPLTQPRDPKYPYIYCPKYNTHIHKCN